MGHAILDAPRAETADVRASLQRQRHILVPGDEPVCIGRLVEINGADWKGIRGKVWANESMQLV